MTPANTPRPSKAQRTASAREQARQIREAHQRKEKRTKLLVGWGIVAAVVVILAIIAAILVQNKSSEVADTGSTPANVNQYGGAVIGAKDKVVSAGPSHTFSTSDLPKKVAQGKDDIPKPAGVEPTKAGQPVNVVAYVDLMCPACGNFESTNAAQLAKWRNAGDVSVEYRVLGFLDSFSTTNYSSRAANAAAAVLNKDPGSYNDYLQALFAQQPEEGGPGLTNDKLNDIAKSVGADGVNSDIQNGTFRPFVKFLTDSTANYGVKATPTIFVGGHYWDASKDGEFIPWAQKIIDAEK